MQDWVSNPAYMVHDLKKNLTQGTQAKSKQHLAYQEAVLTYKQNMRLSRGSGRQKSSVLSQRPMPSIQMLTKQQIADRSMGQVAQSALDYHQKSNSVSGHAVNDEAR
jgi:hypothetical protein